MGYLGYQWVMVQQCSVLWHDLPLSGTPRCCSFSCGIDASNSIQRDRGVSSSLQGVVLQFPVGLNTAPDSVGHLWERVCHGMRAAHVECALCPSIAARSGPHRHQGHKGRSRSLHKRAKERALRKLVEEQLAKFKPTLDVDGPRVCGLGCAQGPWNHCIGSSVPKWGSVRGGCGKKGGLPEH